MWTHENRPKYNRDHLRYPSDLTDDEWAHVEPFIPPAKRGGGKRRTDMRAVMNGVMYVLSTGCQWRYLPKDFPAHSSRAARPQSVALSAAICMRTRWNEGIAVFRLIRA